MDPLLEQLREFRIIPVVAIDDAANADALGQALVDGGLAVAEITFRTAAAAASIEKLAKRGDMLVGAGTVLNVEQVRIAVDSGARFIVSPGFNPKVVSYCLENTIPITPGIATPTDIEQALGFGLQVVKFFPAEAFGGLKTLKAISAPYGAMRFIPTGGISAANLRDYLAFSKVWACGGSWMVKSDLIAAHDFAAVTRLTREAVGLSR
ncbi:MAG TPA: bifunctional 4-hydroxy-2-oxoglutarate aldolase/2-dehydro-3-deoxy-phosphogluconate aldolase [bacterium]|nr:bifunctional 4-hydroxy-2-oxoglutarate aldolase/2-dehydro-3-deoxy-phosphogluconate aldolase [bacterium]HPG45654.1 bifunctional 4-hydroxy-2-oxoglutarate aldolase/2-dehydro-3-deoxy-phosphogluconate aldolase [bacterium]HPM97567.1 bifunctional 4-hydroxy-2-oxoglutarate aldolase/2-dehydro-3-deoxy-phosphogluconate aldolase [bacterium]